MSLKEYKRKRDFKKTPEPAGREAKTEGRHYVIQKHAASRLHYDFRLEHNGTLKSWAVPKGPSLDPSVKSLAVQVEDHPLDYAKFEGVIPQGEYGGGTVMVWDEGTWEPEVDAEEGLRTGKLKFTLHGKKLKGSWALVRMGGRAGGGGKNWLLIKHKDAAAKPVAKFDVLKKKAKSVLTNRDLDGIAEDADAVWSSNKKSARNGKGKITTVKKTAKTKTTKPRVKKKRHAVRPFAVRELAKLHGARLGKPPKDFKPELATLASRVPPGEGWLHELKFDGYRILAHIRGPKVSLFTRNDNDWTARFRVVAEALAGYPLESTVLDGEVVALDEHGVSNFQKLQNSLKTGDDASLVYYVFDAPFLNAYNLTKVSLVERKSGPAPNPRPRGLVQLLFPRPSTDRRLAVRASTRPRRSPRE